MPEYMRDEVGLDALQKMKDMKLFDEWSPARTSWEVTRVPNGWLYRNTNFAPNSWTFVPEHF